MAAVWTMMSIPQAAIDAAITGSEASPQIASVVLNSADSRSSPDLSRSTTMQCAPASSKARSVAAPPLAPKQPHFPAKAKRGRTESGRSADDERSFPADAHDVLAFGKVCSNSRTTIRWKALVWASVSARVGRSAFP